jgi:hypothetical protein
MDVAVAQHKNLEGLHAYISNPNNSRALVHYGFEELHGGELGHPSLQFSYSVEYFFLRI